MESAVHGSDRNAQPLRYLFDADRLEIWRNSRRAVVFRHAATLAILASITVFFSENTVYLHGSNRRGWGVTSQCKQVSTRFPEAADASRRPRPSRSGKTARA